MQFSDTWPGATVKGKPSLKPDGSLSHSLVHAGNELFLSNSHANSNYLQHIEGRVQKDKVY